MKSIVFGLFLCLSATAAAQSPDAAESQLVPSPQRQESGFIDKTGLWAFHVTFDQASSFSCGLALIRVHGKFGYIDTTGKIIIDPQFDRAEDFSDDLALVKVGPKWGYIDKTGNAVIPPQFDDEDGFHEGLAIAFVGRKRGFIDKKGHFVMQQRTMALWLFLGWPLSGGTRKPVPLPASNTCHRIRSGIPA